ADRIDPKPGEVLLDPACGTGGFLTSEWKRQPNELDKRRVLTTVWLYHLNKREIETKRGSHMRQIRTDLDEANAQYQLWDRDSPNPNLHARNSFDRKITEIRVKISDRAEFAGAKRCAVRAAITDYEWIEEFVLA